MRVSEAPAAAPFQFPPGGESIGALQAAQTINVLDAEDTLKYLPSLFLRKRNPGDTQAVMGTRIWGVSSSARSLVYADGVVLSALIANNNTIGGPRWGLVAPADPVRGTRPRGARRAGVSTRTRADVERIQVNFPSLSRGFPEKA